MAYNQKKGPPPGLTGIITRVRRSFVAGGAAGNLTVTGIKVDQDYLVSVQGFGLTEGTPNTFSGITGELVGEFSITADNTINNTSGTATTGKLVEVLWYDADYGETSNPVRS